MTEDKSVLERLKEQIRDLERLLVSYRSGLIAEKKKKKKNPNHGRVYFF